MHKAVEDALAGKFKYDAGRLVFTPEELELRVHEGGILEGGFSVREASGLPLSGRLLCFDTRMELLSPDFAGEGELLFRFHSSGLPMGSVHKGRFEILSNQGEYAVPYSVQIDNGVLNSSEGPIRNIFHFVNLARRNWKEALEIFYSADFEAILPDMATKLIYRGFSAKPGASSNMDEFLIALKKKTTMEYRVPEKEFHFSMARSGGILEGSLRVLRKGWGYTHLEASWEGDFISLNQESFGEEDFSDDELRIPFRINGDLLHRGKNRGLIRLSAPHECMELPVVVMKGEAPASAGAERKRLFVQLIRCYEDFRLKKIARGEWIVRSESALDQILSLNEQDLEARLFQAQLFISARRLEEAEWILSQLRFRIQTDSTVPELAFYYYLVSLLTGSEEDAVKAAEFSANALERNPGSWRLRWLFLYVSDILDNSPAKRFLFLEEVYSGDAVSPLISLEAWFILKENPSLLSSLEGFGQGLLFYLVKKGLMDENLVRQVIYLAGRVRRYSPALERLLIRIYAQFPSTELLRVLVMLLMKGKPKEAYLPYLDEAIQRDVHITGLYEAYLNCLDPSVRRELPPQLFLFFAEDRRGDWRKKAYLFATALKNEKTIPEIVARILQKVAEFTLWALQQGLIDQNLGYLYGKFFRNLLLAGESAESMARLLFYRRILVPEHIHRVCGVYEHFTEQVLYPVEEGEALLPMFEALDCVFLEDDHGNRFLLDNPSQQIPLCPVSKIARAIAGEVRENPAFDLYIALKTMEPSERDIPRFTRVLREESIAPQTKRQLFSRILPLLSEAEDAEQTDAILSVCAELPLSGREKKELVSMALMRGAYDVALKAMKGGELNAFDAKDVLRTGVRILERGSGEGISREEIGSLLIHAFLRDRYTTSSILYLSITYPGRLTELEKLWKVAFKVWERSAETELEQAGEVLRKLGERILLQSLVTGAPLSSFPELYHFLKAQGGNPAILLAVICRRLFEAFVLEKEMPEFVFREAEKAAIDGEQLPDEAKLALLKFYAVHKNLRREEFLPILRDYFREYCLFKQVFLPEFRLLTELFPEGEQLEDKAILEYRVNPRARLEFETESEGRLELYPVCPGVWSRAFVLFPGESLQYVVRTELDGISKTERGELNPPPAESGHSRYAFVERILEAQLEQRYDRVEELLYDYRSEEYLAENLFRLR